MPQLLILYFVDCGSLYNLVNKVNLVHNLFLVYLNSCLKHVEIDEYTKNKLHTKLPLFTRPQLLL